MPSVSELQRQAESSVCDYCRSDDCQRCVRQLRWKIIDALDDLEQGLCRADQVDNLGINIHLRYAWGARDAILEALAEGLKE